MLATEVARRTRDCIAALTLALGFAPGAIAQETPDVPPETRVWVTTADEREREGLLVSISPATLLLRVHATTESIALADVRRIEVRDSLRNGARNGALVGAAGLGGFGAYLSQALCEMSEACLPHDLGRILALAGVGAGAGVAAGAAIDYAIKGRRLVYASDGSSLVLRVAPLIRGRSVGVRFSLTWPR